MTVQASTLASVMSTVKRTGPVEAVRKTIVNGVARTSEVCGSNASSTRGFERAKALASGAFVLGTACVALTATAGAAETKGAPASAAMSCDDGLKTAMGSVADTKVLLVRQFKKGEPLLLAGASSAATPIAGGDLCLVKLLVGPGNPGPEGAPSTSAGIGIEVLLPSHESWNERIRAYGNSGWAGSPQASLSVIASDDLHAASAAKGFVVATSDHGHVASVIDPSFALKPDGSINTVSWKDFSERSLKELADKTKKLTKIYYGRPHRYAYWDGFSTGGRQGLKLAQAFPDAFDGILVGAPAINWTKYHTANLYGQIAMKQDLGQLIGPDKLAAVTQAAIKACGGAELGFIIDPLSCRYDPTKDVANLCKDPADQSAAGGGSTSKSCLTPKEAAVINKAWYGQTADGSVPAPATDNGNANDLSGKERIWFGYTRGTDLVTSSVGGGFGVVLAADQTALELQNPTLGSTYLVNATGKGANRWLDTLNYAGLADAQVKGISLQRQFSAINTDNPDLGKFATGGGKIVMYQGLADEYIPAQGAINYYERVTARMGGAEAVQNFFRFYLVPGFTHSGRSEGAPSVPVPQPASGRDEMFAALQNWVEKKDLPKTIQIKSSDNGASLPLCIYPLKTTYGGTGPVKSAASYACK